MELLPSVATIICEGLPNSAGSKQTNNTPAVENKWKEQCRQPPNIMEEHLAELRHKLAEAEARAAEEQQRRQAAEEQSRPKNLLEYLEACHGFSLALEVVTDATLTTQGDTTKPAGRLFPRRILPWLDFPAQQENIWEKLSTSAQFGLQRVYPSTHQLEYVRKYLDPISSELGLRHYARETVQNPVRSVIEEVYKDDLLRRELQLRGTMTFESHTNLGQQSRTSVEETIERLFITEPDAFNNGGDRQESTQKSAAGQCWRRWRRWPEGSRNNGSILHIPVVRRTESSGCLDRIQATAQVASGPDHCWSTRGDSTCRRSD